MNDPNKYGEAPFNINGCVTIDVTDLQNDYLDEARVGLKDKSKTHGCTDKAVSNLLECNKEKISVHIVGHGDDGFIITGAGKSTEDPKKKVALDNEADWKDLFEEFRNNISSLYLLGCESGAGVHGARLLSRLAEIVGVDVAAPTGTIYCESGEFSLESGSTWQVAKPGEPTPAPIKSPSLRPGALRSLFKRFFVSHMEVFEQDPIQIDKTHKKVSTHSGKVTSIDIFNSNGVLKKQLKNRQIKSFLALIDFARPITMPGKPSGLRTGAFDLKIKGPKVKNYLVVSDRLVQDKEFPDIGYYCRTSIRKFFS